MGNTQALPRGIIFLNTKNLSEKRILEALERGFSSDNPTFEVFLVFTNKRQVETTRGCRYDIEDLRSAKTVFLAGRPLTLSERAMMPQDNLRHVRGVRRGKGSGRDILEHLALYGFNPDEALRKSVAQADALSEARIDGYELKAALKLFSESLSAEAEEGWPAKDFSLQWPMEKSLMVSGRLDPTAKNLAALFCGHEKHAANLALISYAITAGKKANDELNIAAVEQHLKRGLKEPIYGELPDQGMVLATETAGEKLNLTAALPMAENALATKAMEEIAKLQNGESECSTSCGRIIVTGEATGNDADVRRLINFFKRNAPVAARKARSATVSLFLPFEAKEDVGLPNARDSADPYDGVENYFQQHLEPLFGMPLKEAQPSSNDPVLQRCGNTETRLKFRVNHPSYPGYGDKEPRLNRSVSATRVHCLTPSVVLLEAEITLTEGEMAENFTLAELLDFTASARQVSRVFDTKAPDPDGQDKFVTSSLNGDDDVLAILRKHSGLDMRYEYLGDDRAFVFQSAILEGPAPTPGTLAADHLQIALERYNTVDGWGPSRFYAEEFSRGEFAASAYPRFAQHGSALMCTDHSFSFLGFADKWAGDKDGYDSFALDYIHEIHMPGHYRRMVIYALLIRARLNLFEKTLDSYSSIKNNRGEVRILHQKFATFVHRAWRETVSSQVQGQELFALITERFAIRERIDKLSADFEAMDRVEAQDIRVNEEARATRVEKQRLAFAFLIGLATSALGMLQVLGNERTIYFPLTWFKSWFTTPTEGGPEVMNVTILFFAILVFTIIAFALSWALALCWEKVFRPAQHR
ncbi:hypothetical protein [Sedimentitalea todarodis]|uniref:Uncharacterized protein n=1 Tax=Sedimentitalea todarodis TaxID=1631240 RepID=A0ABU3VE83_9RHOB|nr:hypothetical protein [Sedimentitalea todarodis]MDU9004482.1 hypothetical protein [Sedimentitalea todarodis]